MNYLYKYIKYKSKYFELLGGAIDTNEINFVYKCLEELLKDSSHEELLGDDNWQNRLCSSFLKITGVYNWSYKDHDVICNYTHTNIQTFYGVYNSTQMKSKYSGYFMKELNEIKTHLNIDKKFCALYGAPILFKQTKSEPHAYIIYKNKDDDKLYVYNGRAKLIVNGVDLANEHIQYTWGEELNISPIEIAIQSHADGLEINDCEECTKIYKYKGLCYPVVVICAFLFMKTKSATFEEIINYLHSKTPDELSTLFLKMNNYLYITVPESSKYY